VTCVCGGGHGARARWRIWFENLLYVSNVRSLSDFYRITDVEGCRQHDAVPDIGDSARLATGLTLGVRVGSHGARREEATGAICQTAGTSAASTPLVNMLTSNRPNLEKF
jgi:hypothetical protein